MSTVTRPRLYRWTREEYDAMIETGIFREKNVELIEGEIVEMTPIGPPHSAAVTIAADLLRDVFGREYFIRIHMPFVASSRSKPQPDIAVIHGSARDFVARDPHSVELIVEVADTPAAYDRSYKGGVYAKAGVPEY
jgi:Uma2 family endonuclease